MTKKNQEQNITVRTNKATGQPKEVVLYTDFDKTFSLPMWLPIGGLLLGLIGEIVIWLLGKTKK